MSKLTITIEINSIPELEGLEAALDLYTASEGERLKDEMRSATGTELVELKLDQARVRGADRLLAQLRGGK